jgi:hypothetical protein
MWDLFAMSFLLCFSFSDLVTARLQGPMRTDWSMKKFWSSYCGELAELMLEMFCISSQLRKSILLCFFSMFHLHKFPWVHNYRPRRSMILVYLYACLRLNAQIMVTGLLKFSKWCVIVFSFFMKKNLYEWFNCYILKIICMVYLSSTLRRWLLKALVLFSLLHLKWIEVKLYVSVRVCRCFAQVLLKPIF